jgi:hypothetical protein
LEGVVAAGGEGRVRQVNLVLLVENPKLDARRVNERVRPGELDAVDAFLDGQQAVLADHCYVFRVVDRELRALAGRQGHQIHGGVERHPKDQHK